jgi:hypothetical protein
MAGLILTPESENTLTSAPVPKAAQIRLILALSLGFSAAARAATDPDGPARVDAALLNAKDTPAATRAERARPRARPPYRDTKVDLEQSATAQTLGVGSDYQSRNPTYDLSLALRPRYYFVDPEDEHETLSLRAVLAVGREFTDSDTTTKRGEVALSDLELWTAYTRRVWERDGHVSELALRLPTLVLPTSKISYRSGKILGLGTLLGFTQTLPLLDDHGWPEALRLTAAAGYTYGFARAAVPTNPDFVRVRLDPEGVSLPGDQLNGAAHAQHQVTLRFVGELLFTENLKLLSDLIVKPVWKYALPDSEVCGVVSTGCVEPRGTPESTRHSVITEFKSELGYEFGKFAVAVGYANLALQLGPDGKRRSPFYSPDARFYLTLSANLDKIVTPEPDKATPSAQAGTSFPSLR